MMSSVNTFLILAIVFLGIFVMVISGCGGGDNLAAPAAQSVQPLSQPASRVMGQPLRAGDTVSPMATGYLLGDIDGDGHPTVGDAIKILRFVVQLDVPTSTERWLADVDGSGAPDVGDAIAVLRAVVDPINNWPLPWPPGGGPPPPPF